MNSPSFIFLFFLEGQVEAALLRDMGFPHAMDMLGMAVVPGMAW